jgi:Lrp/AsnC family leucine-responsive transcriptional regulator
MQQRCENAGDFAATRHLQSCISTTPRRPMPTELDRFDLKLLQALQQDIRITSAELAELVGLSPTACQRRIKRMKEEGVIEAEVAIVSPAAVGRPLLLMVSVSLERERTDIIDHFKAAIQKTPEVMSGYYVTGEADFVLIVSARDMADYENFTRRFFYGNAHIKGFKTTVVMDRVKASFELPVDTGPPVGPEIS